MFIVRDKTTLVVAMLAADAPVLDGAGLLVGDTRFIAITPDTYEVVEGDGPESLFIPGHLVFDGAWAAIDQGAYDVAVAARTPAAPVPEEISDRQFFQALAMAGLISKAEAIDAVAIGAVPAAMEAFFAGMSDDEEFAARMLLQGATKFERHHPLVEAFGALNGMTPSQVDDLWRSAAAM